MKTRTKGQPLMFIDTHAHSYDEYYASDPASFIDRAIAAGVDEIYMPNCDSSTVAGMMALARQFPGVCKPMMGLHPTYVKEHYQDELDQVAAWLGKEQFIAVGEIGLDYYWDKTYVPQQKEAFDRQMHLARKYELPIVIHSRESTRDCIDMVRAHGGNIRGVFHCFSGTLAEAREIADLGFYLGIGGVVTYKRAGVQEVVKAMPLDTLVLETDAPYLSPIPFRNKRNESSYLPFVAEQIAALKDISIEEVAEVTTLQARKLFRQEAVVVADQQQAAG